MGYIRSTIRPALGHLKVRKVRGPILDQLSFPFIGEAIEAIGAKLARVGLQLAPDACLFANDPMRTDP